MATSIPWEAPVTMICALSISELRFAFLFKGGHAYLGIRCPEGERREISLDAQTFGKRHVPAPQFLYVGTCAECLVDNAFRASDRFSVRTAKAPSFFNSTAMSCYVLAIL